MMRKILIGSVLLLVTSFYFFTIEFTFLPNTVNSKILVAVFGIFGAKRRAESNADGQIGKLYKQSGERSTDIDPVSGKVDARKHDLFRLLTRPFAFLSNALERARTTSSAKIRNDAV